MSSSITTITRWPRQRVVIAVILGFAVMGGSWLAAHGRAAAGPVLTFEWSMPDRFGLDANQDGVVDEPQDAGYLTPSSWTVTLDSCASPAGQNPPPGSTFRWKLTKGGTNVNVNGGCKVDATIPSLGTWTVLARLVDSGGTEISSTTAPITPVDYLITSVGDSVASGEGNPDTEGPKDLGPFPFYQPVWEDKECHRSALAGPAQAAIRLERRDPHSSVTFLHLACSGATVQAGLLGPYEGVEPDPSDGPEPPQVARAVELAAGRPIDAMLVSIGANNAKFSTIVETCLKFANCNTFQIPGIDNAQKIYDDNIVTLPAAYASLDDALDPLTSTGKIKRVLLSEYFDPSKAADGSFCAGNTANEQQSDTQPSGTVVDGISQSEWQWASQTVVAGLNAQVQAGVQASDDDGGQKWTYVDGVASAFDHHGYCSTDRWVRTLFESFSYQQNQYGAFHPNAEGQLYAYANRIEAVSGPLLGVGGTPLPFVSDPTAAQAGTGIASFVGTLDALDALNRLKASLPFDTGSKIDEAIQKVFDVAAQVQATIENLASQAGQTLTKIDNQLDDVDGDGDPLHDIHIPGLNVDVSGELAPHLPAKTYDVAVHVKVTIDDSDPALSFLADHLQVGGTAVDGGLLLDASVAFKLDPTNPVPAKRFTIPVATTDLGSIGFSISADLGNTDSEHAADTGPAAFSLGLASVTATGTVDGEAHMAFRLVDPNSDGVIDLDELSDPGALFDLDCGSQGAHVHLNVAAGLAGLQGHLGTISLDDDNLCDGIATPSVQLGDLEGLRALTPADIVHGLGQLTTLLQSLQSLDDVDLPFVKEGLSQLVAINQKLVKFFVDNGLTDPADPMANLDLSPDQLASFDTFDKIVTKLATSLGLPADALNLRWQDGRILVDLSLTVDPPPLAAAGTLDVQDQLARAGLTGLVSAGGTASVGLDANFTLNLTFGIDLNPGLAFADRFFIQTGAGDEAALDAVMTANLDLTGQIAVLSANVKDQSPGSVTILRRHDAAKPMVALNIDGKGDDRLTLNEAAALVATADLPIDITVNTEVPTTVLTATASLSGIPIAGGTATISWPDVTTLDGPTGLNVTLDGSFTKTLLPFAFDQTDPKALIGEVLTATRGVIVSIQSTLADSPALAQSLPLVGLDPAQIDPALSHITSTLDSLIQANDSLTLDSVEQAAEKVIGQALNIPPASWPSLLTFSMEPATASQRAAIVVALDLGVCTADRTALGVCSVTVPAINVPLNLALGTTGDASGLAGLDTTGNGTVAFDAHLHLVGGVELPNVIAGTVSGSSPTSPPGDIPAAFIKDTTSFELGAGFTANPTLTAALGPIKVSVGTASDPAAFGLAARVKLAKTGATGARVLLDGPSLSTFLSSLVPTPAAGIHDTPRSPTCGQAPAVDACAKLPIYVNATPLGNIVFRAPNLLQPAGWTFTGADTVLSSLTSQPFLYSLLVDGLQSLADQLDAAIQSVPADESVPLLGTNLQAGLDVIHRFKTGVLDPALDLANDLANDAQPGALRSDTQNFFIAHIGPGTATPLLLDANHDGTINGADVTVLMDCDAGAGVHTCADSEAIGNVVRYEVHLPIGVSGQASTPPFDLGFPGFRLASAGSIQASAGFAIDLAFGLDKTNGFYIPTNVSPQPELRVFANAALPNVANAPDLDGDLAFLPVHVEDKHAGDDVSASIGVDLTGGGADGRLTLQQLDSAQLVPTVSACANVLAGLEVTAPELDGQIAPSSLPRVVGDLHVAGGYSCDGSLGAPPGTGFSVGFDNVAVDPGSLITDFLKPIAHQIRQFTGPLEPTIDAIRKPIPGVAEAAKAAGLAPPNWYDLFKLVNQLNMDGGGVDGLQLIDRVIQLTDLVRTLDTVNPFTGTPAAIPLGSFSIDASAIKEPVAADKLDDLLQGINIDNTPVLDRLAGAGLNVQLNDELKKSQGQDGGAGGFTFPALQDPKQLLQLLVGKDVSLVRFDAGLLAVKKDFQFTYPIGPFDLYIGGYGEVKGHFAAGYDTYGLRRAYQFLTDEDPANDGFYSLVGGLVQGFYIDDLDTKGVDVPEITLEAELTAGAGVGVPGFTVGAEGGVHGEIDFNIHDADGKLRFEDMGAQLKLNPNPLCFFDARAHLDAFIRAALHTFLGDVTYDIANVVLFDDPDLSICTQPAAPLATVASDGTLQLATSTSGDTFTITGTAPGQADVTTLEGATQHFTGVTRIFADGKGGRDSITYDIGTGNALAATICGGTGDDVVSANGGPAKLYGDSGGQITIAGTIVKCANAAVGGRDTLTGGPAADTLDGGGGDDALIAAAGNDTLVGGDGNDVLQGGTGNDTIDGGAGVKDLSDYSERTVGVKGVLPGTSGAIGTTEKDTANNVEGFRGGTGDDELHGTDAAASYIDAGGGNDTVFGGALDDIVLGGDGNDSLQGGAGTNQLFGNDGDDTFVPGLGGDQMTGGAGYDGVDYSTYAGSIHVRIDGLANDGMDGEPQDNVADLEQVVGTASDDTLVGGVGNEKLVGLDGADHLDGGGGNDLLLGGAGDDLAVGGPGDDALDTAVGEDVLSGGDGNDMLAGGPDGDVLNGEAGDDEMRAGGGDDSLRGGTGADIFDGGGGVDTSDFTDRTEALHVDLVGAGCDGSALDTSVTGSPVIGCGLDDVRGNIEVLLGGSGADYLAGDASPETISGGAGDDTIAGGGGADGLDGGDGNDLVFDASPSPLATDTSADQLLGSAGNDILVSNGGGDTLLGGDGNDDLRGGSGSDTLSGNAGNDSLRGNAGADNLVGGDGNDIVDGGIGNDTLSGDAGNDTLIGGDGDDTFLEGTAPNGADKFIGGAGTKDNLDYSLRTGTIVITRNGIADDGAPGEMDNVGADVEKDKRPA
jgi:Ca2+-binding RTX toxin-like protein